MWSVIFLRQAINLFKGALLGLRHFLTIASPLKMMKNAFHFMLKASFVLEISTLLSRLFGYVEKRLGKKAMVNFKIYDVIDLTKIITIKILPNIWRSKGNQAMKFSQLIKYSVGNTFLQKSCRKWGKETGPRTVFVI